MWFITNLCVVGEKTFHRKRRGWWECGRELNTDRVREFYIGRLVIPHIILFYEYLLRLNALNRGGRKARRAGKVERPRRVKG